MPFSLQINDLQAALVRANAHWTCALTSLTRLGDNDKLRRLGANPPGGHNDLQQREMLATQSMQARGVTQQAAGAALAPQHFNWRDKGGSDYMTAVRDQGGCGSCVAFGTLAALEAKIRIDMKSPSMAIDLSEAQLFFCDAGSQGRNCTNGWWPEEALKFLVKSGVADEPSFPYSAVDQACRRSADAGTRSAFVSRYHSISDRNQMKDWLATQGPLVACFTVYDDFFSYSNGVYHHVMGDRVGGHCVCVVGYDDAAQCWICKNSWGAGWGEHGYFRIRFGDSGIDSTMWAIEGAMFNKVTLGDTSNYTPALGVHNNNLVIAWTGRDSPSHLNVMWSNDGYHFQGKVTLGETSIDGPGFAVGNGRAFLAWTGTDSAHHLNVISSTDCRNFSNKVTLGDTASYGPALAWMNGTLYLAWVGTDRGHSLNVMSSRDGMTWQNKVTLRESSDSQLALCAANGLLYLVWQGTDPDSRLNMLESRDGVNWGNKITMGDTSVHTPSAAFTDKLMLGWTGRDANHSLNSMVSTSGSHGFAGKMVYQDSANAGVALMAFRGQPYIAWSGTDPSHKLNVMRLHS